MSMELQNNLYAPVYDTWGVSATITTASGTEISLTAKNHTMPPMQFAGFGVEFQSFKPMARVRASELPSDLIYEEELLGGTMLLDGKEWSIKSFEKIASPNGFADGEITLFLKDDLDV